jgi:nuclear pore complex protein Nup133
LDGSTLKSTANSETEQYDKNFRPFVKPSDALGVFTSKLDPRFDDMDEGFRHKLLDIMKADDKQLKAYIDKSQLDAWYRTTRDCAEKTVEQVLHTVTVASEAAEKLTNGNGSIKPMFTLKRGDARLTDLFGV